MRGWARPSLVLAAVALVAACASDPAAAPARQAPAVDVGVASPATPPEPAVVDAARREGAVVLYTNANDTQIKALVDGFGQAYPGIEVQALSLGAAETFQRYLSESATGGRTADVIINSDALGWMDFVQRGAVADYTDANVANLPAYAQLLPGVVAMSEDPLIAVFNKALIPADRQPTTLAALAELAPQLKGQIGTYTITNPLGFGGTFEYLARHGDAGWDVLQKLGPNTSAEDSAGTLITKLTQGQYQASFFLSGASRATVTGTYSQILDFRYLADATPLLPRGIAVTAGSAAPNAARVFMNWVLSVDGQEAGCGGGFTPYRDGVDCPFGLPAIAAAIGKENIVPGSYAPAMTTDIEPIKARWNTVFGR